MSEITHATVDAAIVLDADHFPVEEELPCATCGDVFEAGEQVLEVYAPEVFNLGKHRAVWFVHLRCYQGEEVTA